MSDQIYLNRFQEAVNLAQAGYKTEAHALLGQLAISGQNEPNLLLWLAFTAPDLRLARSFLDKIAQSAPDSPSLADAYQWLGREEAKLQAANLSYQNAASLIPPPPFTGTTPAQPLSGNFNPSFPAPASNLYNPAMRPNSANTGWTLGNFRSKFNQKALALGLNGDFILSIAPAIILVLLLGDTPFLFPFRIFTSTLHEAGHCLAGILTGSQVGQMFISPFSSSFAQVEPGDTFSAILVASAGYLGSVLFGGTLLLLAKDPRNHRRIMLGVVAALVLIMVLFVHNLTAVFLFTIILFAWRVVKSAPDIIVSFSLYMLALLSCFNSLTDLLYLINISPSPGLHNDPLTGSTTDATILQRYTGVPATTWALLWSVVGIFMLLCFVLSSLFVKKRVRPVAAGTHSGQ